MKIRKTLFILAPFFLASVAFADGLRKMTLTADDAVRMALENNKSLKREALLLRKHEREKRFLFGDLIPSAALTGAFEIPYLNKAENPMSFQTEVVMSMEFSPSIVKKIERTKIECEMGGITMEKARRLVEADVRILFHRIIYEEEYASHAEAICETLSNQLDEIEAKYNAGLLPENDLLSARIELNKQRSAYNEARDAVLQSKELFLSLLGIELNDDYEIEFMFGFPSDIDSFLLETESDFLRLQSEDAVKNLDAAYLEKSLAAAKAKVDELKVAAYGATISAGMKFNPSYEFHRGTDSASGWQKNGMFTVGLAWNFMNFLPFSPSSVQIKNAKDDIESLRIEIAEQRVSRKTKISANVREARRLVDAIKTDIENRALADQAYAIVFSAYQQGLKDYSALRDASDQKKNAEVNVLYDLYSLIALKINMELGM